MEAIVQEKSKPLAKSKEESADNLIRLSARIESLKYAKLYYETDFQEWFTYFRDLVPRTSHEDGMDKVMFGNKNLLTAISYYFEHEPRKNITDGIALARAYFRVLMEKGIIHDHD